MRGSKLNIFCARRKFVVFSVGMEFNLVFVMVVEIDSISVWGIELEIDFSVGMKKLVWLSCGC